jgi:hypothetical protein
MQEYEMLMIKVDNLSLLLSELEERLDALILDKTSKVIEFSGHE